MDRDDNLPRLKRFKGFLEGADESSAAPPVLVTEPSQCKQIWGERCWAFSSALVDTRAIRIECWRRRRRVFVYRRQFCCCCCCDNFHRFCWRPAIGILPADLNGDAFPTWNIKRAWFHWKEFFSKICQENFERNGKHKHARVDKNRMTKTRNAERSIFRNTQRVKFVVCFFYLIKREEQQNNNFACFFLLFIYYSADF